MRSLRHSWADLLPEDLGLGDRLLARWAAPPRHFHGLQHLADCLEALAQLGSTARVEALAIWFHDSVHHNRAGADERASAALARSELTASGLPASEVSEVERLVLITIDHAPLELDGPGARISDADLAVLGAKSDRYWESVAQLRAEFAELNSRQWRDQRRSRVMMLLGATPLFHTAIGQQLWADKAIANLHAELQELEADRC